MFTVILLSDTARAIFEPARIYFEPYFEAGDVAICEWNQSSGARSMAEAVPGLRELIKGKSSWRAIVVDHPRDERDPLESERRNPENPFDFADNASASLNLEDSKHPLIRIAHILLGYPQMSAKRFKPYLQYEDADTWESRTFDLHELRGLDRVDFAARLNIELEADFDPSEGTDEELFGFVTSAVGQKHNNVRRVFKEVHYSRDEQEAHARLVERYRMKEVRPSEVVFVATRADIEEDDKALLRRAWIAGAKETPSRFVERNDYPPMSRFAVYELLEPENSGYRQDLLRFWLSVLTVAQSQVPSSAFQADHLYRLAVEFEDSGLGEMLNAHISQLAMVRDHLDHLIAAPVRPPEMEVSDLLSPIETDVAFDGIGGEELDASTSGYGLAGDRPRSDHHRWGEEIARISSSSALFMRKPRRLVARAVFGARELARVPASDSVTLDEFQREELEDGLTRRLRELVVPATSDLLDQERLQRRISAGDRRVRDFIATRMSASTIGIAAAVSLGIWIVAMIPYLVQTARTGFAALADGVLVVVLLLALVAGCGLLTLVVLRRALLRRIRDLNDSIGDEVASVRAGAAAFAGYLSRFATYRRGAERLRGAIRLRDRRTARLTRLRALRSRIVVQIDEEKEIVKSLGVPLQVHGTSQGLVDFDPEDEASERRLFRFPEGEGRIPFNDSGETVGAPYDFITRLELQRLSIFEPHDDGADA